MALIPTEIRDHHYGGPKPPGPLPPGPKPPGPPGRVSTSLAELQKEVDARLAKILTSEQKKLLCHF